MHILFVVGYKFCRCTLLIGGWFQTHFTSFSVCYKHTFRNWNYAHGLNNCKWVLINNLVFCFCPIEHAGWRWGGGMCCHRWYVCCWMHQKPQPSWFARHPNECNVRIRSADCRSFPVRVWFHIRVTSRRKALNSIIVFFSQNFQKLISFSIEIETLNSRFLSISFLCCHSIKERKKL